jgi:hypothetical protein
MTLFLIASTLFAALTLVFVIAFLATGGKNNTLRYIAGGFGLLSGLMWLIRTLMR